ncbi:MAG: hypothetical protein Q7S20_14310 [Gemmatimonadaceae bacterium]|nr:hypothetical protein [Gemmatimonadaceae bacterium]
MTARRFRSSATVVFFAMASVGASQSISAQDTASVTQPVDTSYVIYDEGPISLPLGVGLRAPSYNRIDGLALPWGPYVSLASGRLSLDPTVTYRSNLGNVDPRLGVTIRFGQHDAFDITGGRETFTNDSWIRSDFLNSLATIGVGSDSRNYFRADRVTGTLSHSMPNGAWTVTPSVGVLHENAWSTGIHVPHSSAPWSFLGRSDSLKMRRINPAIARGHMTSGLGAIAASYEHPELTGSVEVRVERAFDAPEYADPDVATFTQITIGSKVSFPTFGTQTFSFRGHALITPGTGAPPQRFAWLGGAGTLATVDLLALGGDRLLYVEGEYYLPLSAPVLPFVGPPVVSARYAAGSAGIGELPDLIQNIGVSLGVKLVKAQYHIDPNYRKTPYSRRNAFSLGFSLSL